MRNLTSLEVVTAMRKAASRSRRDARRHLISTKRLGAAAVSVLGVGAVEVAFPAAAAASGCNVSRGGASTWNEWLRYAYCDFSPTSGTHWRLVNNNNDHQAPLNEAQNEAGQSAVVQACYLQHRHTCGTPHTMSRGNKAVSHYSYVTNSQISAKAWNGALDSRTLLWAWAEWGRAV